MWESASNRVRRGLPQWIRSVRDRCGTIPVLPQRAMRKLPSLFASVGTHRVASRDTNHHTLRS